MEETIGVMDIPEKLKYRDYTLIIDKSGSMRKRDQDKNKTRWEVMKEIAEGLAYECEEIDPDGMTVYTFSDDFKRYDNVSSSKVEQLFEETNLGGLTNLDGVLKDALDHYFQRKAEGSTQPNGEIILVFTDGKPDDERLVIEVIVEASNQIEQRSELGICFIQIGTDQEAANFLDRLDNQLDEYGAKLDICHALKRLDVSKIGAIELLTRAVTQ